MQIMGVLLDIMGVLMQIMGVMEISHRSADGDQSWEC